MFKTKRFTFIPRVLISSALTFVTYQKYHQYTAPAPYDFGAMKDKNKTIVVVGGGMVGLTAAYTLGKKYPQNNIILLEKEA